MKYEPLFNGKKYNLPLFIINDKVVEPTDLNRYELNEVAHFNDLDANSSTALYGSKGALGVHIITLKKK